MKKYTLFIILFCFSLVKSQGNENFFFSEYHIIPEDTGYKYYYLYKIPYNRLVFEKDGNNYKANFKISYELATDKGKFINRQINNDRITVDSFEKTNSSKNYLEGLIEFQILEGKYSSTILIGDNNSDKEVRLEPVEFSTESVDKKTYLSPFLLSNKDNDCDSAFYYIANFDNNIPFTDKKYDLLIPSTDSTQTTIYCAIVNNGDTVYSGNINREILSSITLEKCRDKIIFKNSQKFKKSFSLFRLPYINENLFEGEVEIILAKNKEFENVDKFGKKVKWFHKPFSLMNKDGAAEYLRFISDENFIDELEDSNPVIYNKKLFKFWKKYDPDTTTAFNPVMEEYYSRIDYSIRNFSTFSKRNGANSDRGKTYILFGKPDNIERSSTKNGYVIESWIYSDPYRKFTFIDKNGTGDFKIINE